MDDERISWCYGDRDHAAVTLAGLTARAEADLTVHERIEGVWSFLIWTARRYQARLLRGGVVIDVDDLVQGVVAALMEKDCKWDPGRGKYTTFVSIVFRNVASDERDRIGVVRAPSGAWTKLKRYRRDSAQGTVGPTRTRTMNALAAVLERQGSLRSTQEETLIDETDETDETEEDEDL